MIKLPSFRKIARNVAIYSVIIVGTLALLDLILIGTGLFQPPSNFGHPVVGWLSTTPTGSMEVFPCFDPADGARVPIERNERGHRTAHSESELIGPSERVEIAVTGDSHTDLCLANEDMHFGFMGQALADRAVDAAVFAYGAGGYSPLQEYLAVAEGIVDFEPDVLVMNLYTGNDFYDILRVDDRPYFVATDDGYEVAPPVWYDYDPPGRPKRSRVFFALRTLGDRVGVRNLWTRLRYLYAAARAQDSGLGSVVGYVNDLRRSRTPEVGYDAAFAAQILNQQLFFHHFPGSEEESMRRVRALLQIIRERHPDLLTVMSPIPSYQLVQEQPVDGAFTRLLEGLPVSYEEGVDMEHALFDALRRTAEEEGWLFVDNLAPLQAYEGSERLYNDFDYHITVVANEIIGSNQGAAIQARLSERD